MVSFVSYVSAMASIEALYITAVTSWLHVSITLSGIKHCLFIQLDSIFVYITARSSGTISEELLRLLLRRPEHFNFHSADLTAAIKRVSRSACFQLVFLTSNAVRDSPSENQSLVAIPNRCIYMVTHYAEMYKTA